MCDPVCFLDRIFCYEHAMTLSRFFKICLLSILSSLVCLSPPIVSLPSVLSRR